VIESTSTLPAQGVTIAGYVELVAPVCGYVRVVKRTSISYLTESGEGDRAGANMDA
jgi:hypothetical protein